MEVCVKLFVGCGVWLAIWILGNKMGEDVFWLDCGEIDIMEFVGYNLGIIYVNVYIGVYNWVVGINKGDFIWIVDVLMAFYVYVIDWMLEWIDFYVDFICYFFFEWDVEVDF